MMKKLTDIGWKLPVALLSAGAALLLGWLFFWPVPFDPAPDDPLSENPAGTGVFARNNLLAKAQIIPTASGPEGIALDSQGRIYTGLEDGSIVRIENAEATVLANTGGRPIGVEFDAQGNLIIADIFKGLISLSPAGDLTTLVTHYQGKKMIFVDDLAIADDGKIYFSDASAHWGYDSVLLEIFERRPSGRLFVYDPQDGSTSLLLDKLLFANGVALGPDDAFVLVNETFAYRIIRLWLKGPRAGETEVFAENLPGFLDNITEAPGGGFWLAIVSARNPLLDALVPRPLLREIVWRLVSATGADLAVHHSWAVKLDNDGTPLVSLEDDSGHIYDMTSVIEHDGMLYLGSINAPQVGILTAPESY